MQEITGRSYGKYKALRYSSSGGMTESEEDITIEEPLEIRLKQASGEEIPISVTMRTPTADTFLAIGFLYSEGIIRDQSQILSIKNTDSKGNSPDNMIVVEVTGDVDFKKASSMRNFTVNSSCGVCGKSNINDVFIKSGRLVKSSSVIRNEVVLSLPGKMNSRQSVFSHTGGIHAACLFDSSGEIIFVAEDIGRHNAVDKVVGYMLSEGMLYREDLIMQVSGRAGFEILQKAAMAGIPVVSSVSAPSSLAIDLAESLNVTLIGFVRENRFTVYSHKERVQL